MVIRGRVWVFGDDIDTDQIYPGKYLPLTDKIEMARHAMVGAEQGMEFIEQVALNDILAAGKNFGCGSSREHAATAIKGIGVSVVIARSFARIFRRNAVNIGLPLLEFEKVNELTHKGLIEVDCDAGTIKDPARGIVHQARMVSELEMAIMKAGGLLEYLKSEKKLQGMSRGM